MPRYKLIIAYDGTEFFGWQQQKELPTIAQTLQDTFKHVFKREISILGASRTDAGVHALGQVASFDTDLVIPPQKLQYAWNKALPPSILIRSVQPVDDSYNPHHNVVSKEYHYLFFQERPLPEFARYGWHYPYPVDHKKLNFGLSLFIGTHDFRSFCSGEQEDTMRTITNITVEEDPLRNGCRIVVIGPRFLHHMIRRISGACLQVASRDNLCVRDLKLALMAKSPAQILPNAPPQGLTLFKITYSDSL
jgi:tRNA pseudouridine38-40 synthase